MLNFPDAPTRGDVWGSWTWDGSKWVASGSVSTFPDAPLDHYAYGRLDAQWARVLPLNGGTLTGPLIVGATATVLNTLLVDGQAGGVRALQLATAGAPRWVMATDTSGETGGGAGSNFALAPCTDNGAVQPSVISISRNARTITLGGPLLLAGNATQPLQAVTLQQLTAGIGGPYLPLTGGTLSNPGNLAIAGALTIGPSTYPVVYLNASAGANATAIQGQKAGAVRWQLQLPNGNAETGSNAGSDLGIYRYADDGTYLGNPFAISRANGNVTLAQALQVNGYINCNNLIQSSNGRVISVNSAGNPSFSCWDTNQSAAAGMFLGAGNNLYLATMDGSGSYTTWRMYVGAGGNLTTAGTVMVNGNRLDLLAGMGIVSDASYSQILWDGGNAKTYYAKATGALVTNNNASTNIYTLDYQGNVWMKGGITVPGDSNLMNVYVAGGLGLNFTGVYNSGYWFALGWDGHLNLAINGGHVGAYWNVAQNDGRYKAIGAYTPNQTVDYGSNVTFGRLRATGSTMNVSGTFFVADNEAYYLARGNDGHWRFVENNNITLRIDTGGSVFAAGSVSFGNDGNFLIANGGSGRYFAFASNWYFDWNNQTGTLAWVCGGNGVEWVMHANTSCYNNLNWVGGFGAYQNLSDERAKTDVEDATVGLREVLDLKPISFTRVRSEAAAKLIPPRTEIGFGARALQTVIPEAVTAMGITLPDGSGGLDSDQPSLGIDTTPIVAALVNGMKELTARLARIEGGVGQELSSTMAAMAVRLAALEARA